MYIILVIPITVGLVGNWSVRYTAKRMNGARRADHASRTRCAVTPCRVGVRHDRNARTELKKTARTLLPLLFIPHFTRTERRGRKSPPAYYPVTVLNRHASAIQHGLVPRKHGRRGLSAAQHRA